MAHNVFPSNCRDVSQVVESIFQPVYFSVVKFSGEVL